MADTESGPSEEQAIMAAQGLEEISEDLLKGTDDEVEETEVEETEDEETEVEETKAEETEAEETEVEETEVEETEVEETEVEETEVEETEVEETVKKTPKGYVPLQALHETRSALKEAKTDIEDLKQMVQDLKSKPTETEEPSFKVLTDEEFDELASEDPLEAVRYQRRERKHLQEQADLVQADKEAADIEESNLRFIDDVTTAEIANMAKLVPGLHDEAPEAREAFKAKAVKAGFTNDMFFLTDPGTKVIVRGETEPKLLGSLATSVMAVLAGIKDTAEPDTIALEAKLRKTITAELITKFKAGGTKAFKSLTDAPKTSTKKQKSKHTNLSESELANLSEADQEKYLSGE